MNELNFIGNNHHQLVVKFSFLQVTAHTGNSQLRYSESSE